MKQAGVAGFLLQAKRSLDNGEDFFGLKGSSIEKSIDNLSKCSGIDGAYDCYVQFITERTGHSPSDCGRLFSGIDAQLNSVGIFSMSKKCDEPLMWSHYAGEHTGICIGFEIVPGSQLDHSDHFLPVIYSDALPEMDKDGFQTVMAMSLDERGMLYTSSFKMSFTDKTFQKAITTKPTCWSYEEEWRYVEAYPGLFDWPGHFSELTFGLKCTDERRAYYIQLAEEHVPNEVRLFQIRKRHGTNSLERVELEKRVTSPRRGDRASNDYVSDVQTMDAA